MLTPASLVERTVSKLVGQLMMGSSIRSPVMSSLHCNAVAYGQKNIEQSKRNIIDVYNLIVKIGNMVVGERALPYCAG
jgi:hypothetical protein